MLRKHSRSPPPRALTGEHCLDVASRLRAGLSVLGVHLHGGTDLDRMLRKIEELGARHTGSFWEARFTDQEKLDVRYIEQAERLAAAVEGLRSPLVSGDVDSHLLWFRKRLDTLINLMETAQNFLVEIEVGAALAAAGLRVSFEEPDLVVSGLKDPPTVAIPVKRPQRTAGVDNCVRDATRQARRRGLPGVVLVCLDAVLNADRDGKPLDFLSRTLEAFNDGTWNRFKQAVESLEDSIRRRSDPSVMGMIWLARMPGAIMPTDVGARSLYTRRSYALASVNQDHWEGTTGPFARLLDALYRGIP